ncbi:hypothetical protein [Cellulophaga omnivescoria]|uniref:hypothetical protein n=1 Tax=Cellulophaga omnivescoria TaxID=1888890 RepID=UPI000986D4DE|nr:hypothetical protein [Cellulophaga omnivescoria]WBU89463.1 hypothetical protein PBN93_00235 [Cellulophaga omnivescoria]
MKAIITFLFILTLGLTAKAQVPTQVDKTVTVLNLKPTQVISLEKKVEVVKEKAEVARLYRFKNAKIKRELTFTVKKIITKIA